MNTKKYILGVVIILSMTSCEKFLDTKPDDFFIKETYYSDQQQLSGALASIYDPLGRSSMYGTNLPAYLSNTADDTYFAFFNPGAPTNVAVHNFDYTNAYIASFWSECYLGIERANIFIENIKNATGVSQEDKNAFLGEALFMRGYYHFLLAQNFGDVPLKITPTKNADEVDIPRTPVKQVYEQIIKDMTQAEGLVYSTYAKVNNSSSRVVKPAVQGILARVCLHMAGHPVKDESKYAEALSWAQKVVSGGQNSLNQTFEPNPVNLRGGIGDSLMYPGTASYAGYRNNPYSQVFLYESRGQYFVQENMWEVDFNADPLTNEGGYIGSQVGGINGVNQSVASEVNVFGRVSSIILTQQKLFMSYNRGDYRRDWVCAPYSFTSSTPTRRTYRTLSTISSGNRMARSLAKWRREYEPFPGSGTKNTWNTSIKYPLLRYADVLMMLAEAESHVNGATNIAVDAVNQIRRRAFAIKPGSGPIKNITITSAGSGYTSAPKISLTNGAPGDSLTAVISGGRVTNIIVNVSAVHYSAPPTIRFTGGGGTGAAATISLFNTSDVDLPSGIGREAMLDSIKVERYREFAGESLRRNDLIRWGIYLQAIDELVDYNNSTGIAASALLRPNQAAINTLAGGSKFLLWPIPSTEVLVNKGIKQNVGW